MYQCSIADLSAGLAGPLVRITLVVLCFKIMFSFQILRDVGLWIKNRRTNLPPIHIKLNETEYWISVGGGTDQLFKKKSNKRFLRNDKTTMKYNVIYFFRKWVKLETHSWFSHDPMLPAFIKLKHMTVFGGNMFVIFYINISL